MSDKLPWFKFCPSDWMSDSKLRAATSGARGLWIDMLCVMHDCRPRGYLQIADGSPFSHAQVARLTGLGIEEVSQHIGELESLGVLSVTTAGVIYSRRMTRDERKRNKCSEAGKMGGGRPRNKGHPKGDPKGDHKGQEARDKRLEARDKDPPNPPLGGEAGLEKKPRPPNPIWDAVCSEFGLSPVTAAEKKSLGRIVADLNTKGATPDEFRAACKRYRAVWPNAACTPRAITTHYDTFRVERNVAGSATSGGRIEAPVGKYDKLKIHTNQPRGLLIPEAPNGQTASAVVDRPEVA